MPYMRDPEGNVHHLTYVQALVKENAQSWTKLSPHEISEYKRRSQYNNTARTIPAVSQSQAESQQATESLLTDFVYQSAASETDCQSSHGTRSHDTSASCHDNSSQHSSSYDSQSSSHDYSGGHDYSSGGDSW